MTHRMNFVLNIFSAGTEEKMDCIKTGRLIAKLRKEKGLTQKNMADALGISNKTISKWETGLGCPDLSLWPDLSTILGAEISQLMEGEIVPNKPDNGNMLKVKFYVCPDCGNILFSSGSASVFCCGKKLEALKSSDKTVKFEAELSDTEYYITLEHEMTKEHYISFAALVKSDRVYLLRLYPEQNPSFRLPAIRGARLVLYCVKDGLMQFNKIM